MDLDPKNFIIEDIYKSDNKEKYAQAYFERRQRKGMTLTRALRHMRDTNFYGAAMVIEGDVDVSLAGEEQHYANTLRPALQVFDHSSKEHSLAGMYIVIPKNNQPYFFADCTVNVNPSAEELAEIAIMAADAATDLGITPRVAMLSFSNFGSARYPESRKVSKAAKIMQKLRPDIIADGEIQADTALNEEYIKSTFPFSRLQGKANVLVFPNLDSGNIAYKLMDKLGEAKVIGPILLGNKYPMQVLQRNVDVDTIFHMAVFSVLSVHALRNSH